MVLSNAIYPSEGAMIGSRDAEGEIAAVSFVRVYRSGYCKQLGERLWDLRITVGEIFAGTLPSLYTDSNRTTLMNQVEARTKVATHEMMPKFHAQHASGPHYYVAIMATLPEKQGQGHCSNIMRAINRAADTDQLPCYLECSGEKNTKVYMRFGYKVMGQCSLSIQKDAEAGSGEFTEVYCMVREPGEHGSLVEK